MRPREKRPGLQPGRVQGVKHSGPSGCRAVDPTVLNAGQFCPPSKRLPAVSGDTCNCH